MMNCCFWVVASVLVAVVTAFPTTLKSRDVSPDTLQHLELFSQYAAASYCVANNNSPGTKLACAVGNCPQVEAADTMTTAEFQHTPKTDGTGFVAVDSTNQVIVASFRGSQSMSNFKSDADTFQTTWDLCTGCMVHRGFMSMWIEMRQTVIEALTTALAKNPNYKIVVTGHSMGAAIAALAATDLRVNGMTAALYSYGQPRVGNGALSSFISKQTGGNYRVTHTDDPVPRMPDVIMNYRHIVPEYFISRSDDDILASDIQVINGTTSLTGNAGTTGFNVSAHQDYFGPISACGSGLLHD